MFYYHQYNHTSEEITYLHWKEGMNQHRMNMGSQVRF